MYFVDIMFVFIEVSAQLRIPQAPRNPTCQHSFSLACNFQFDALHPFQEICSTALQTLPVSRIVDAALLDTAIESQ